MGEMCATRSTDVGAGRRKFRVHLVVPCLILFGCLAAPSLDVSADEFGLHNTISGRVADNAVHNFCYGTGFSTSNLLAGAWHAMYFALDPATIMSASGAQTCTISTDVVFGTTTMVVDGVTVCLRINAAGACDSSSVKINPAYMSGLADYKQTSCHEVGHSVGLAHVQTDGNDCMGTNPAYLFYSSHHVTHIDNQYS